MSRSGMSGFVWQHLKRLPRSVWIVGGLALVLIPVLLVGLLVVVVGGAWQAGGALIGQGSAALERAIPADVAQLARELPEAATLESLKAESQQRMEAELERLKAAAPVSAEALEQGLAAAALPAATEGLRQWTEQGRASADAALGALLGPTRPAADVSGEDPPGIVRLPGFVRTAFVRDGESLKVSWSGPAPHAEVVAFYTAQLAAAGYKAQVLEAGVDSEVVSFESTDRRLTLSARKGSRGGSEIEWAVH
ncbi:MAG: hypothetical protein IPK97_21255 [Ahniella sp.]|nr:hypothetical protein [Ahniella sp.]